MKSPLNIAYIVLTIAFALGIFKFFNFEPQSSKASVIAESVNSNLEDSENYGDGEDINELAPEILDWSDYYIDPYLYNYSTHKYLCCNAADKQISKT